MAILKFSLPFSLLFIYSCIHSQSGSLTNYKDYHHQVNRAEKLVVAQDFATALYIYENIFQNYDYIFLRDYQVATQLALLQNDLAKAKIYLERGIRTGWSLKSIKKNKIVRGNLSKADWKTIKKEYPEQRKKYEANIDQELRAQVKKMYKKDQWKALKALFRFSDKGKTKYAERKFAPHSEQQMIKFQVILDQRGYPGEKLIGNNLWISTILSHHNSISTAYNQKDSIYPSLKPQLINALEAGQISPFELAIIDEWYIASKYDRTKPGYGILDAPTPKNQVATDQLRTNIFLRPIVLRNDLIEMQHKTGMNFYLPRYWY